MRLVNVPYSFRLGLNLVLFFIMLKCSLPLHWNVAEYKNYWEFSSAITTFRRTNLTKSSPFKDALFLRHISNSYMAVIAE